MEGNREMVMGCERKSIIELCQSPWCGGGESPRAKGEDDTLIVVVDSIKSNRHTLRKDLKGGKEIRHTRGEFLKGL